MTFDEVMKAIDEFRDERDWRKFHTPKDLAISVSLEASELLENFQWVDSGEALARKRSNVEEELADVLIYCLMLAADLGLDPAEIINSKLETNRAKYPVDKAKGSAKKYTDF